MKPKKITVTLTRSEAENLLAAAGQILGHADALKATFQNRLDSNAAMRGHDKIQTALHPQAIWTDKP